MSAMFKTASCGFFWLCLASGCFGQAQAALCPSHIEAPSYPLIAKVAHITGKVILTLTLDADGKVVDVKAADEDEKGAGLLKWGAIDNIRRWAFSKPPSSPYTQTIVYDFELDAFLPGDDGNHPITKISFDLPDRVTIAANARIVDHGPGDG